MHAIWRRFKKRCKLLVKCVHPPDQKLTIVVNGGSDILAVANESEVGFIDVHEEYTLDVHLIWLEMMAE